MSVVSMSGLAHQPVHSQLSAKDSHEFCLGAGLVLTNRRELPAILENFPFCVSFDKNKIDKALRSRILQTTLFDYDLAALADLGFLEPKYLTLNNDVKVLTFRAAQHARVPMGFALVDNILMYCDSYSRIIIPTFDTVMYMIAVDERLPEPLRVKAYNSYSSAPGRNIFRAVSSYSNIFENALISVERLANQQGKGGGPYTPQSGSLSSCVQAKGAIQTCASDIVTEANHVLSPLLETVGLPDDIFLSCVHLVTFRKPLLSAGVAFCLYVLIRFFIDFCVTIRFVAGCLVGMLMPRPPKKPVSFVDSLFAPQSGSLSPDDGAAFLGIQEKTKNTQSGISKPASASAPGVSAIPTMGFSQGLRTAPLKPPKKDPNDGPLNGFGVGI